MSNGKPFFPGFMPGSEAVMPTFGGGTGSGWSNVILPPAQPGAKPADFNLAENTMKYLVHTPPKPDYDYQTFDFDRDIKMVEAWSAKADAKNPDLSKFRKRGGKLLMTYGWSDTILQPMMGVNYYEAAMAKNGPSTPDFFRLFMVPGHGALRRRHRPGSARRDDGHHQLGGKGPGAVDDGREQGRGQQGGAHAAAVRLSAGGAPHGHGQHRRRGQLPLRGALTVRRA